MHDIPPSLDAAQPGPLLASRGCDASGVVVTSVHNLAWQCSDCGQRAKRNMGLQTRRLAWHVCTPCFEHWHFTGLSTMTCDLRPSHSHNPLPERFRAPNNTTHHQRLLHIHHVWSIQCHRARGVFSCGFLGEVCVHDHHEHSPSKDRHMCNLFSSTTASPLLRRPRAQWDMLGAKHSHNMARIMKCVRWRSLEVMITCGAARGSQISFSSTVNAVAVPWNCAAPPAAALQARHNAELLACSLTR
jgi:hypothetical protein